MYIKLTLLTCGMNLRNKEFNEHKFKSGNYNQSNLDYRGLKSLNSWPFKQQVSDIMSKNVYQAPKALSY